MNQQLKCTVDSAAVGYQTFTIGQVKFERCEYFAYINCPKGEHLIPIDAFLRALMRDVAWGFFYGTVAFDDVFGTTNHYGNVDIYMGSKHSEWVKAGRDYVENFKSDMLMALFRAMLSD